MATIKQRIIDKLNPMKVGDSFDKVPFVKEIYGKHDFFVARTFDVHLCNAKKDIAVEFPEKKFDSASQSQIKRVK